MSDERPQSERGARSTQDGAVPGLTAIEVDREIQFRQLVWMAVGLVILTALAGVVVFFLLRGFLQAERDAAGPPPPMTAPAPVIAGPQLLARPEHELARVRQLEDEQIGSYGWIDAQQGLVRIPIDRALEIVAAQGLPSRPSPPPGSVTPGAPAEGMAVSTAPGLQPPVSPDGVTVPPPQVQPTPVGAGGLPDAPAPTPGAPGGQR